MEMSPETSPISPLTTQRSTFVTLRYPGLLCFVTRIDIHRGKQSSTKPNLAMVCVSNCIATAFSPGTAVVRGELVSLGASLLRFEVVTTTNSWVLSRSQLHPGCYFQIKVCKATRQESREISLSFNNQFSSLEFGLVRNSTSSAVDSQFSIGSGHTHTTLGVYTTWFFLAKQPPTLLAFRSFFPRAPSTDNNQKTKFK